MQKFELQKCPRCERQSLQQVGIADTSGFVIDVICKDCGFYRRHKPIPRTFSGGRGVLTYKIPKESTFSGIMPEEEKTALLKLVSVRGEKFAEIVEAERRVGIKKKWDKELMRLRIQKEKKHKKEEAARIILDKRRKEVRRWIEALGIDPNCVVTIYPIAQKGEKHWPVHIPIWQLERYGLKTIERAFGTGWLCGRKNCLRCKKEISLVEKLCPHCGTRQNTAGR